MCRMCQLSKPTSNIAMWTKTKKIPFFCCMFLHPHMRVDSTLHNTLSNKNNRSVWHMHITCIGLDPSFRCTWLNIWKVVLYYASRSKLFSCSHKWTYIVHSIQLYQTYSICFQPKKKKKKRSKQNKKTKNKSILNLIDPIYIYIYIHTHTHTHICDIFKI